MRDEKIPVRLESFPTLREFNIYQYRVSAQENNEILIYCSIACSSSSNIKHVEHNIYYLNLWLLYVVKIAQVIIDE